MGILDSFERGLERAVNGAFAKTFRSGLQPVEISSALKRELDTRAAVVARDRILVPNSFRVLLSPADHERMTALGSALITELDGIVKQHAAQQGFQFAGPVVIDLVSDESISKGMIEVESSNLADDVRWVPVVDIAGKRHPLRSRTVIGRGSDADITIDDTGTSRKHVEIVWDGSHAQARDLGSTNGSQLNGRPFQKATLEPDSIITIGRTAITFRVVPQTSATSASGWGRAGAGRAPGAPPQRPAAAPKQSGGQRAAHDPGGFWG
ncbi:DUF2662 domain-containing protein [Humibacter sp. BT305]|nr:DUF2662 domain-containing protein [Humibacter sp. BT305]